MRIGIDVGLVLNFRFGHVIDLQTVAVRKLSLSACPDLLHTAVLSCSKRWRQLRHLTAWNSLWASHSLFADELVEELP